MHSIDESVTEMQIPNQKNVLSSFVVQVVEEQPGHFLGPCSACKQLKFLDIQAEENT